MKQMHAKVAAAAATTVCGLASLAVAIPTVDGTRDAEYGAPLAVQTVNTGFGDNQSELDAMYASINNGKLSLFFAGNLESNYNKLVVFFDTKAGGQNTILASSPIQDNYAGMKFDAGFSPDYSMIINRGNTDNSLYVDFSELPTAGGGFGGYAGKITVPGTGPASSQIGHGFLIEGQTGMPPIEIGYNDSNTGGVVGDVEGVQGTAADQAAAAAVTTGTEFTLDLSALGIEGNFSVLSFVNGSGHNVASNQFLPGLPAPQANLGNNGSNGLSNVDLTTFAGDQFVPITYTAPVNSWALASGGDWNTASNWTQNVAPTGPTAQATLAGPAGTGTRTLTLSADTTVQRVTFNNAGVSYAINGTSTFTVNASPLLPALVVVAGNHSINAPVVLNSTTRVEVAGGTRLSLTNTVNAAGRDLFVSGGGTFEMPATPANSITVNGGTARLTGSGTATLRGVSVDAGSTLDLTNAAVILDYDATFSPKEAIKAMIVDGRLSSSTRNTSNTAIGYRDTEETLTLTSFNDVQLDATALVFRATYKGDTDLNRTVNFDDLLSLAQNYDTAGTGKTWSNGDSNYDGVVNFDDLLSLAQNYGSNGLSDGQTAVVGADFAADFALAQSLVPEPATLGLLGGAAVVMLRRRK